MILWKYVTYLKKCLIFKSVLYPQHHILFQLNLLKKVLLQLYQKFIKCTLKTNSNSIFLTCLGKAVQTANKKEDLKIIIYYGNNKRNYLLQKGSDKDKILKLSLEDLIYVKNKYFIYALCDSIIDFGSNGYITISYDNNYLLSNMKISKLILKNLVNYFTVNFYLSSNESTILLFLCSNEADIKNTYKIKLNSPKENTIEVYSKIFHQNSKIIIDIIPNHNLKKIYYLSTCEQYFLSKYLKYQSKYEQR